MPVIELAIAGSTDIQAAAEHYRRDGATVLRRVVDLSWIERLSVAIDRILENQNSGVDMSRPGEGRFFGDVFSWLNEPEIEAFVRNAGLAAFAATLMGSGEARFFYDQLLVKEPGTPKRTPWHQDLPYWPATGEQIMSIWVPLDPASPESGVVSYVKGSHRWNAFFPMEEWTDNEPQLLDGAFDHARSVFYRDGDRGRTLADIRDHPERYEFLTWNVEPGDVIVHHPLAVHGAPGNMSHSQRRRAIAMRWFGDDARWDDSRPHFMRTLRRDSSFPYPSLQSGDPITDPLFPRLWPQE